MLQLPAVVSDPNIQQNFDYIANRFPISNENLRVPVAQQLKTTTQAIRTAEFTLVREYTVLSENWERIRRIISGTAVVAPVDGWYLISGWVKWAENVTGTRYIELTSVGLPVRQKPDEAGSCSQAISINTPLSAGASISLNVFHNAGVELNVADAVLSLAYLSLKT